MSDAVSPSLLQRVGVKRSGLTLIEVVVSTVIVAFILTASVQTVATATSARSQAQDLQLGPSLARDLMSEILCYAYTDPDQASTTIGLDSGENASSRSTFDDVDDFDGWSSIPAVRSDGTPLSIGAGWKRTVSVQYVDSNKLDPSATDTGLKKITVTALSPTGDMTRIDALRSSLGANERPPHADRTIVSGTTVAIELTSGATAEYSSTFSRNHAHDE